MTDPPRSLMRAAVVHTTGGAHVLRIEDAPRPTPSESEVLIAVRAAAVNPVDWKIRRGFVAVPLPTVLGMDVSGAVVTSSVADFAVGDDVFGIATSGSHAELTTASAAAIARKPPGVTYEQAAAIPVSGLTAWQGLFERGILERGQTVLIAGAAGGVGHLAVQLARRVGATVIGTGSSRNRAFVLGLGADVFVDYTEEDVGDVVGDVDVVLDTVGGPATTSLLPTLRPRRRDRHGRLPAGAAARGSWGAGRAARHAAERRAVGGPRRADRVWRPSGRDRPDAAAERRERSA